MKHPNLGMPSLALFILLIAWSPTSAQQSKLKVGVSGEALLHWVQAEPIRFGHGTSLGIWLEQPLNHQNGIRLSVARRVHNGYGLSVVATSDEYFPREYHRSVRSTQLSSLHFADAHISWEYRLPGSSPWSLSLGARVAYLLNWRGNHQTSTWARGAEYRLSETSTSGGPSHSRQLEDEMEGLSRNDFQSWDGGIQIHLRYQLSRGLHLQAGLYRGMQNLFQPSLFGSEAKYVPTTFSLGFSARLF